MINLKKYLELLQEGINKEDFQMLKELESLIITDYKEQVIKETKGSIALKKHNTIKKFLKDVVKLHPQNTTFHGVYYNEIDQKSYLCNGYIMLELNDRFVELENDDAFKNFNYKSIINNEICTVENVFCWDTVFLDDIKFKAKTFKDNKKGTPPNERLTHFNIRNNQNDVMSYEKVYFDIKLLNYVIELLEIKSGEIIIKSCHSCNVRVNPIIIENKIGKALILPVMVRKEEEEEESEKSA